MSRGPGDRRRSQRLRELNLRNEVVSQVIDLDSESDGDGEIEAVAVVINEGAVRRPLVIDVEREGTRRRSSGGDDEGLGGRVIGGRIAVVRPFLRRVEGQREEVSGGGQPRQVAEVLRGTNGRLEETSDEEEVVEVDKEEDEEELLSVGWSSVQEVSPDREDPSLSPDIEEVSPPCPVASSESEEEVVQVEEDEEVGVVGIEEAQLAVEALQIGREETEEPEGIVVSDQEERVDEGVTLEQDHVDVEAEEDGQDKEEDDMIIGLMGPAAPQQIGGELEKTQQREVVEVEEPPQQIDVEVLEEVAEAEVSQNQEENEVTINATEPVASSTSSSADSQQQIPDHVPVEQETEATEWPVSDTSFCSTVSTSASTIVPSDPEDGQEEEDEVPLVITTEGQDLQEETVTREEEPKPSTLSSSSSPSPPPAAVSTSSSVSSASDEEPLHVESPPQVATTSANKPSGDPEPDPVPGPSSQPPRTQFIMPSYWQYLQKSPEERKEVCRQYAIAFFAFEAQRKLKAAQKEEEARKAKLAKEEEKRRRKAEADERARQLAAQPRPKRTVKRRVPFGAAPEDQIDGKLASKEKELPGTSREALENLRKRKRSVSCGSSGPDAKKMKRSNSSQSSLPRSNPRSTSSSSPTPSTSTQPQQSCPLENDTGWVGADKWLVEKLLDARYRPQVLNRVVEYRIKWKGWADEHNSWEPSAHVDASSKRIYWKRELKDINKLNRKLTRVPPPATDFPPTYFMTDLPKVIDTRKDPTQLTATGVM